MYLSKCGYCFCSLRQATLSLELQGRPRRVSDDVQFVLACSTASNIPYTCVCIAWNDALYVSLGIRTGLMSLEGGGISKRIVMVEAGAGEETGDTGRLLTTLMVIYVFIQRIQRTSKQCILLS